MNMRGRRRRKDSDDERRNGMAMAEMNPVYMF